MGILQDAEDALEDAISFGDVEGDDFDAAFVGGEPFATRETFAPPTDGPTAAAGVRDFGGTPALFATEVRIGTNATRFNPNGFPHVRTLNARATARGQSRAST